MRVAPIHRPAIKLAPFHICGTINLAQGAMQEPCLPQHLIARAKRRQPPDRLQQIQIRLAPVDPAQRVVLTIGVVVTVLGIADLVPGQHHRYPLRQHQRGHQIDLPPFPLPLDLGIRGGPLDAEIHPEIAVVTVAIVLSIRQIVPNGVPGQIREREAVMRRHKIHRRPCGPPVMVEVIRRPQQTRGQILRALRVSAPEPAHPVAVLIVPFRELGRELTQLIATRPNIPWFGNQPRAAQNRILPQRIEEPAPRIKPLILTAKRGGEIKPEPVHPNDLNPIAQAVQYHAHHIRVRQVQSVSRTRIIGIISRLTRHQAVIAGIVQPAKAQRRAKVIGLGGVVIDHVQNDLDAHFMQPLDHIAETRTARRPEIPRLGREKADGVISPIVAQATAQQKRIIQKALNREQFNRGDPQPQQMFDHRIRDQAFIRSAQLRLDQRMFAGQPFDMGLIDHRVGPRASGAVDGINRQVGDRHHAFGHVRRTVAGIQRQIRQIGGRIIPQKDRVIGPMPNQFAGVRV